MKVKTSSLGVLSTRLLRGQDWGNPEPVVIALDGRASWKSPSIGE